MMALRIQRERLIDPLIPSLREYSTFFGINKELMKLAKPDALIMHPGPINRGVEIDPAIPCQGKHGRCHMSTIRHICQQGPIRSHSVLPSGSRPFWP